MHVNCNFSGSNRHETLNQIFIWTKRVTTADRRVPHVDLGCAFKMDALHAVFYHQPAGHS